MNDKTIPSVCQPPFPCLYRGGNVNIIEIQAMYGKRFTKYVVKPLVLAMGSVNLRIYDFHMFFFFEKYLYMFFI